MTARLLVDTQVVLWLGAGDTTRVPPTAAAALLADDAEVLLSSVVLWEVAIKASVGKLDVRTDFRDHVRRFGFVPLPVTDEHAWAVRDLPMRHRDPFDRLLIAQAQVEGATVVTADDAFAAYDVPMLWHVAG